MRVSDLFGSGRWKDEEKKRSQCFPRFAEMENVADCFCFIFIVSADWPEARFVYDYYDTHRCAFLTLRFIRRPHVDMDGRFLDCSARFK